MGWAVVGVELEIFVNRKSPANGALSPVRLRLYAAACASSNGREGSHSQRTDDGDH